MISLKVGRRGALVLGCVATSLTVLAGIAWAYWTAEATNVPTYSYSDTVGTGNLPAATVTGAAVTLSWSATTTVAGHAVGGYLISRYANASGGSATSAAAGTCAATPVTGLGCTETAVPTGTWYYTITPVLGSWRGTESPRGGAVAVGTAAFTLSLPGGTTTLTAGGGSTLTITARFGGVTDPGYTGPKTVTFSGPGAAPNGSNPSYNGGSSTVTFNSGVATVPVTLYKAETTPLTVTAGTTTASLTVTVNPAAATQFTVPTPPNRVAGTALTISLTALDAFRNTATGYSASTTLSWTGPGGAPDGIHPPSYPANPVTFTAGAATNLPITLYRAENTTLTVSVGSISGTSGGFAVLAGPTTQFGVVTPGNQTAGTAFTVSISALDTYRNPATNYSGAKNLSWAGTGTPTNSPSGASPAYPANPVTFSSTGTATIPVTLVKAESPVLRVSDGTIVGTTATFAVISGAAENLAWTSVISSNSTPSSPCLFTCTVLGLGNGNTVTARVSVTDTYGNTKTNLGAGHTVTVSTTGGTFTAPTAGSSVTLTISGTGPADSLLPALTFKADNGSWTSDTLTASGTGYTAATFTVTKQ